MILGDVFRSADNAYLGYFQPESFGSVRGVACNRAVSLVFLIGMKVGTAMLAGVDAFQSSGHTSMIPQSLGSGSIGCAAGMEQARFIGIEQGDPPGDPRYPEIARLRMLHWAKKEANRG